MMEIGNVQFYHDPLMRGTNDIQELSKTHDISAMDKEVSISDAWTAVGRRVSKERLLADVYETAKTSVG